MADVSQINLPNNSNYFVRDRVTHVELTQAQYDALVQAEQVDPDKVYFITDAPSMSGTSADLSYDGTSKSVYTKIGEMDTTISGKADSSSLATVATSGSYNDLSNKPTIPSNANVLPIESGSSVMTKTYIDSITPQEYDFIGIILNSDGGTIKGCGSAHITMCNGIARIDFALAIENADTTSHANWGINRDYFRTLTGKVISVKAGGVFTYYKPDGTLNSDRQGYGGAFTIANQFWKPSRVYKSGDSYYYGSWADNLFPVNSRMVGCCFGTYT